MAKKEIIAAQKKGIIRPVAATDAVLDYLEELLRRGTINMFGALPFLRQRFDSISMVQAKKVLAYWMMSYFRRKEEEIADLQRENGDLKELLAREERRR